MRLAIADPPYLGRAARWYGVGGRGSGGGRHRADEHPNASDWDAATTHVALIERLTAEFDGWALAAAPASLAVLLPACPVDVRVMVWRRRNAPPSGARVRSTWEPVVVYTPPARRRYGTGLPIDDVLDAPAPRLGFAGAKPETWTRWVLDALGYEPDDELVDLFHGSGAVELASRAGVLL